MQVESLTREDPQPGLCGSCAFARVIENARGSRFYLCRRAETDSSYRKYPPQPVLTCVGFEPDATGERPAPSHD